MQLGRKQSDGAQLVNEQLGSVSASGREGVDAGGSKGIDRLNSEKVHMVDSVKSHDLDRYTTCRNNPGVEETDALSYPRVDEATALGCAEVLNGAASGNKQQKN